MASNTDTFPFSLPGFQEHRTIALSPGHTGRRFESVTGVSQEFPKIPRILWNKIPFFHEILGILGIFTHQKKDKCLIFLMKKNQSDLSNGLEVLSILIEQGAL